MPARDANCLDSRPQNALVSSAHNSDGYGELQASSKRALPAESSTSIHNPESRPPKRLRTKHEDAVNYQQPEPNKVRSLYQTNLHQPTPRPLPNSFFSSAQKAAAMVNLAEDTGGTRTLKLTRRPGIGHNKTSPESLSRGSNEQRDAFVASRGEEKSTKRGADLLSQVGIVELLQQDERPAFIVDLEDDENFAARQLNLLFANAALNEQFALLEKIEGKADDLTLKLAVSTPHRDFMLWVLSSPDTPGAPQMCATPFTFAGYTWRASTIRKYLRIVYCDGATTTMNEKESRLKHQQLLGPGSPSSGKQRDIRPGTASYFDSRVSRGGSGASGEISVLYQDSSNERSSESSQEETFMPEYGGSLDANGDVGTSDILASGTDLTSSLKSQKAVFPVRLNGEKFDTLTTIVPSDPGFFDWTRLPVTSALPPHIQFARSVDWGATSLGLST